MYTQTGYFAGRVHHRPCWRHSRKPKSFFFFLFSPVCWKKSFWVERKKKNIFGCLVFFSEPPFLSFLSFFLLELRVPPGEWFITGGRDHSTEGGNSWCPFRFFPSLSLAVAADKVMLTNQVTNRPNLLCRLALFSFSLGPACAGPPGRPAHCWRVEGRPKQWSEKASWLRRPYRGLSFSLPDHNRRKRKKTATPNQHPADNQYVFRNPPVAVTFGYFFFSFFRQDVNIV